MLNGIFFVCLSLSLCAAGSSLSCKWMQHKFKQFSKNSLDLIDSMANNSTNTTEGAGVDFPNHLYNIVSKASAEDKLSFTVQILEEMVVLFDEDKNNASWVKNTEENFLQIVTQLADGLRSCIGNHSHKKKNRKIQMYFKRLTSHVLEPMDHSAEAWELIRREMKTHLVRADLLASSLLTN